MRTIELKLYSFEELSKEVQQRVINSKYDINTFYDWWNDIYEDAVNIGCIIDGFNLDRENSIDLCIDDDHIEVAQYISKNWGEKCKGYKESIQFIEDFKTVSEDDLDNLEQSYRKVLEKTFLNILRIEYEYRISEEAVKESIISNEYEFTVDGEIFTDQELAQNKAV